MIDFPDVRVQRRQNEFCDAVFRLKAALAGDKAVPVATRQVLVAELGVFDGWSEDGATVLPAAGKAREIARQILLLDYRLSVLAPLAAQLGSSLRHAVRQYAEASGLLLDATARRGPDGGWLDQPRRTEIEALVLALHGNTPPEDGGGGGPPMKRAWDHGFHAFSDRPVSAELPGNGRPDFFRLRGGTTPCRACPNPGRRR